MPHIPTSGGGQGFIGSPAPPAQGALSVPQAVVPTSVPSDEAMSDIVQMLRGGQVGAERFLEVLGLLAGSTLPQMDAPAQQGPPSIQELLG